MDAIHTGAARGTDRDTDAATPSLAGREPVSTERDYEIRYWARTLNCTAVELCDAVRAVGTDVEAVRRHLGPRASGGN